MRSRSFRTPYLKSNLHLTNLIYYSPSNQTLMGKVLGSTVRYYIICHCIPLLRKTQDKLEIIDIGRDIFLFRLEL